MVSIMRHLAINGTNNTIRLSSDVDNFRNIIISERFNSIYYINKIVYIYRFCYITVCLKVICL